MSKAAHRRDQRVLRQGEAMTNPDIDKAVDEFAAEMKKALCKFQDAEWYSDNMPPDAIVLQRLHIAESRIGALRARQVAGMFGPVKDGAVWLGLEAMMIYDNARRAERKE